MATPMLISGLLRTRVDVEDAIRSILSSGYSRSEICVIVSEAARRQRFTAPRAHSAAGGASVLAAILASAGAGLVLPGLRLAIAGPIAQRLADKSSAEPAGELTSVLTEIGVPPHRARDYETGLKEGALLLGVLARDASDAERLGPSLSRGEPSTGRTRQLA